MSERQKEEASARAIHPGLGAGVAHLLGFMLLAVVNAGFIGALGSVPWRVRAAHHFFDAGQLLAAGLLAYGALELWRRFGPARVAWGYVAAGGLAMALGAWILGDDLIGPASDLFGEERAEDVVVVPAALGGLAIPASHFVGRLLRRRRALAAAGALAATLLAVANNVVLKGDYRGIHVVLGLSAATLLGSSLSELALPAWSALERLRRPQVAWPLRALFFVPAALAIALAPPSSVAAQLARLDGAIVTHLLPRRAEPDAAAYASESPWFKKRDAAPEVPPSSPALVEHPLVILVTMDSVRAELLTDPRHAKKLPRLAELADESVFFTEARTPGSGTVIAFSQIFTGKHTFQLRWGRENKRALPKKDSSPRFPELLAADGVQTVTFASFERLLPSFGIARGFEEAELVSPPAGQEYALSEQMMDRATARVAAHDGGRLFLFMHLMDPHYPYDAATSKGSEMNRYVAEAGLCSEGIGRLIDALRDKGLWERTILIVAADHGEGLNKHGIPRHNVGLYEEIVRVPLLIRVPGVSGRRVDTPVTLLDLGPTILDLFGLPTPGSFMGESLVPFLRGQNPTPTRPIVASALFYANAMYDFPYKVIVDRDKQSVEVYDLVADPDERTNLADDKGEELRAMLQGFIQVHGRGDKRP